MKLSGNGWAILALIVLALLSIPLQRWTSPPPPASASAPAATPEPVTTEAARPTGMHRITGKYPACPSAAVYRELIGYAAEKDDDAFNSLFASAGCFGLEQGREVYFEGQDGIGLVKVRFPGETTLYYTALEALD